MFLEAKKSILSIAVNRSIVWILRHFIRFQVFEVAPSLHMVELRKTGGDTLEFHNVRSKKEAFLKYAFSQLFKITNMISWDFACSSTRISHQSWKISCGKPNLTQLRNRQSDTEGPVYLTRPHWDRPPYLAWYCYVFFTGTTLAVKISCKRELLNERNCTQHIRRGPPWDALSIAMGCQIGILNASVVT